MKLTPKVIKEWRLSQGMTQQDMATILGLGSVTVSRWENENYVSIPTGTAKMVLEALIFKDHMKCGRLYVMLKHIYKK
jgi:transcriptional regulator with XRE-family HTH domain